MDVARQSVLLCTNFYKKKGIPLIFLTETEEMSSFFSDNQRFSLINGQEFGPKSVEFDDMEDPGTNGPIVDGQPIGDKMDDMAEDPAYYGKERVSRISSSI